MQDEHLKSINIPTRGVGGLLTLVVCVVCAVVGGYFAVKWFAANVLAEYASNMDVARAAASWSPSDSRAQYEVGMFAEIQSARALAGDYGVPHFERAVALSPFDYRLWLRLASAREQAQDFQGSEVAFRRAAELAPSYYTTAWERGNFLLRRGRTDEAFAELRRAAAANANVLPQLFNIALDTYDGDFTSAVNALAVDTDASRMQMIDLLARRQKFAETLNLWSQLKLKEMNPTDRQIAQEMGTSLVGSLFDARMYTSAFEIYVQLYGGDAVPNQLSVGQFIDGGFERDIVVGQPRTRFGWHIQPQPQAQIYADPNTKQEGARSLGIGFNAPRELAFPTVIQTVVVRPARSYRLEFFYRTQELQTAATVTAQVLDASNDAVIAQSAPVNSGTIEWQRVTVDFRSSPNAQAIRVRLARAACTSTTCPAYGRVWFDNFRLLEQ